MNMGAIEPRQQLNRREISMSFDLQSITCETRRRAPRIVLVGTHKIGKSTFAAGAPGAIFIPIVREEGIDEIKVPKFPTVQRFEDLLECVAALHSTDHPYSTVVIDSFSTLEPLIWDYTCRKNPSKDGAPAISIEHVGGGYGKGYVQALNYWGTLLEGLDSLRTKFDMTSISIGHTKVKRFDDPLGTGYDQYQIDVHDRVANMLYRWADSILFAASRILVQEEKVGFGRTKGKAVRTIDDKGSDRVLYTQWRPGHPGGGRDPYGKIPYELPLTWTAFQKAVSEIIEEKT